MNRSNIVSASTPRSMGKYRDVMSLSELAEYLNVSTKLASRLLRDGAIFSVKVGREYRVAKSTVMQYVRGQKRTADAQRTPKNCVGSVTSNPQGWTFGGSRGIVCVAKNQREVG